MTQLFEVSSSPHVRAENSTPQIMRDVIIGLIPATLFGFYIFGLAAVLVVALSVGSAVLFEWMYQKIVGKKTTINDYSAAVTGLLLGLNLPAMLPIFPGMTNYTQPTDFLLPIGIPIIGSFFAIVFVKQLFGGIGFNFMNPALAARAFLLVSFAKEMATWPAVAPRFSGSVDAVGGATILGALKEGGPIGASVMDAFVGTIPGSIGEISALALLIGGGYLLIRKVIRYHIPVYFIATVAVFMSLYSIFGLGGFSGEYVLYQLFSGGLMIGAFFMATDYVTSPMTPTGQIIFAIGGGIIASAIRVVGSYPEGVSFAIIIMNLAVPLIDKYTIPRCFGEVKDES